MPAKPDSHQTLLRQWDMLRHIPRHPAKATASEIASRLVENGYQVTKRTVERDLVAMSAVFPLLADERSTPYGWSWAAKAAPLDVPQLTPTQALALVLVQEHLAALLPGAVSRDLEPYFRMARQRLSDEATGGAGRRWVERVRIVPPTQPLRAPRVDPAVHTNVTDALLRDLKLSIAYRGRGATREKAAVISPLGLVQRGPVLYLAVAYDGFEDVRTLALHRMSRAEVLSERSEPPAGFDLGRHVGSGVLDFGSGEHIKLVALFDDDAALHLAESPLSDDQAITPAGKDLVHLSATVADTPQLRWWLLGFAGRVEVIEPGSLREEMALMARSMNARYRGK